MASKINNFSTLRCSTKSCSPESEKRNSSGFIPTGIEGTDGDDLLMVSDLSANFQGKIVLNAGAGHDRLELMGSDQTLDLTDDMLQIVGVESIDIRGSGSNSLRLNAEHMPDDATPGETLTVSAGTDDNVDVGGGWSIEGTEVEDGLFFRILQQAGRTLRLSGPRDWSNPVNRLDSNANGMVEPVDVLIIINEINNPEFSNANGILMDAATLGSFPDFFFDATPDGFLAPGDALVIINFINSASGEGEATFGSTVVLPAQIELPRRSSVANPVLTHTTRQAHQSVFTQPDIWAWHSRAEPDLEDLLENSWDGTNPAQVEDWIFGELEDWF